MNPKVYVETTVIGYLTSRPSRDIVTSAHQQLTRDWWDTCRNRFELFASELVVREAGAGDPAAAEERLMIVNMLNLLETTEAALGLSRQLIYFGAVPPKAAQDALHLAIAVTNGVEYLLTWNCRHIANATMRARIEQVCREAGHEPPIICTPEELMETDEDA